MHRAFRLVALGGCLLVGTAYADARGITGYSGQGSRACERCHSGGATPSVSLEGPATLEPGQSGTFRLEVTGGPAVSAGMNVSASGGALAGDGTTTVTRSSQVTQRAPLRFSGGRAVFSFEWKAPDAPGTFTLFGAGLSANGNGGRSGDGTATRTLELRVEAPTIAATEPPAAESPPQPPADPPAQPPSEPPATSDATVPEGEPIIEEPSGGCSATSAVPMSPLLLGLALLAVRRRARSG